MTVTILIGDVREKLRGLPDDHFDCVVTSPPYWALRDYGVEGQIGLEPTLGEHLAVMVDVFREIRRVLKPSGVVFLNYGDCYASSPNGRSAADTKAKGLDDRTFRDKPFSTIGPIYDAQDAPGYGTSGTEGSGFLDRGLSSGSRSGGHKDSASNRSFCSDVGHALAQARGPLTQIRERMEELFGHLPSADCSIHSELRQSLSAILDQVPSAAQTLDALLSALASTSSESSRPPQAGSRLWDMTSACLSSLRSSEIGVREFARMLGGLSETLHCTGSTASLFEELTHRIRCTVACCSLLVSASLGHVEPQRLTGPVLKPKDLCMVPNRLAIALQEDGWWVRSEIIWAKPNPMPESVRDRPATSHEKIFLLTRSERYDYDAAAVRQQRVSDSWQGVAGWAVSGSHSAIDHNQKGRETHGSRKSRTAPRTDKQRGHSRRHDGFNDRWDQVSKEEQQANGRNLRNYEPAPLPVWTIATRPFSEAHFATFPPELAERCLKAGCPAGGSVLDPFGGAGTVGLVADALGLSATLIELNPEYAAMAERRIALSRMGPVARAATVRQVEDLGPLFSGLEAAR